MYFALTDDQREFDAAVRGYLADRFDLDAVRGVVEDAESINARRSSRRVTATPPRCGRRPPSRAGSRCWSPRSTTGWDWGWSRRR